MPERDSVTQQKPQKEILYFIVCQFMESYIFKMVTGSHIGFMQISKIAHGCHLGNQAKMIKDPHGSTNPSAYFVKLRSNGIYFPVGYIQSVGIFI